MEYTSLKSLKTDIIKDTGKIYEVDYFYYKGFEVLWGNTFEEPRPLYSLLKCRPKNNKRWTEKNWKDLHELRDELKNILPVIAGWH